MQLLIEMMMVMLFAELIHRLAVDSLQSVLRAS